ncbi:LysR family transcriptional regulator [Cobetia sp. L2A1]|uniref:LysR family transcriptional regulator n=1 Tax=Cobetia sp. L2A1 TaxID=2686360 RepID=UPI001E57165E|nr:LysR family transcriptional regulator [Cobetia sp. L2A1]
MEHMKAYTELDVFHAVLDAGTFTGAARQLGITHSAISKRIALLEQRLGAQLWVRSTRKMRLTEAGEVYALETRDLMERLRTVEQEITAGSSALKGRIRISCSNALGKLHIMPLLLGFMERYPEVVLDLTLTDAVVDMVHEGMDLAIRSTTLPDSGLIARRLATNLRVICASPDYLAHHGTPHSVSSLSEHVSLILNLPGGFNAWGLSSLPEMRCGFLSNSLEALHAACLNGCGIACLPHYLIADDVNMGRLTPLLAPVRGESTDTSLFIVRPDTTILPRRVRVLIDFLVESFEA